MQVRNFERAMGSVGAIVNVITGNRELAPGNCPRPKIFPAATAARPAMSKVPNSGNGGSCCQLWYPEEGFTLIELMIVIAIVAVLLTLALPIYFKLHEPREGRRRPCPCRQRKNRDLRYLQGKTWHPGIVKWPRGLWFRGLDLRAVHRDQRSVLRTRHYDYDAKHRNDPVARNPADRGQHGGIRQICLEMHGQRR